MRNNFCVIPICGSASRLGNIPKFLLPIKNKSSLLKHNIEKCFISGFKPLIITTPNFCNIIYRYINTFCDSKNITIIVTETGTMSETILHSQKIVSDIYSILMPDVYISNKNCLSLLNNEFKINESDVLLGIFKIREDQKGKLGQVLFDGENNLIDVVDKDKDCSYKWAWGVILWKKIFFDFIDSKTSHIGYGLVPALKNGIKIKVYKLSSDYYDCGTLEEYQSMLSNF